MAAPGGQPGNQNGKNKKIWSDAIKRALEKIQAGYGTEGVKMLDVAAEALVRKAIEGDVTALKELGDRIEGKAVQPTSHVDDDGNTIPIAVAIQFVTRGDK
jgi:hypothetical protein